MKPCHSSCIQEKLISTTTYMRNKKTNKHFLTHTYINNSEFTVENDYIVIEL